jgi:acetyl-CoA carboxylase carboxyl transferase subunit beta
MSMAPNTPPGGDSPSQPPSTERKRGWLSRIAPGVRNAFAKRETPENLWVKCPATGEMLYRPDLEAAQWVTPAGHHMRIGPKQRFAYTFDDGAYERIATPSSPEDPLHFFGVKPYTESLAAARKATGERDSMAIGAGRIMGMPTVVVVQDFAFMGGSLGAAAGETFLAAADEAVRRQCPLVIFTASGGARMQEGTLSLMQMARTTIAIQKIKRAGLPYIVVLTDPTTGGVTASYAMLGDVHLAEPGATIGFSGRRVIEQTIRETLPPGFQTSEFLVERGMVDRVVTRPDVPVVLGSILKTLMLGRDRRLAA